MRNYQVQFATKELAANQTVAELFRDQRTILRLTVEEVARELQISPMYLDALEQGDYGKLPCLIYTRNFVKCYAKKLQLPLNYVMAQFKDEWELFEKHQQALLPDQKRQKVEKFDFWRMPRWIRWSGAFLMIAAIVGYLGTELYALQQPPALTVYAPDEEVVTEKQLIEIEGKADPEVTLTINDQSILSDGNGNFKETVALQPGLNIVEITAKKKYSRENTVFRKVMVQDRAAFSSAEATQPEL